MGPRLTAERKKYAVNFDPRTKLLLLIAINIIMMSGKTVGIVWLYKAFVKIK